MIKKRLTLLFLIFFSCVFTLHAAKYEAKNFIVNYPDEWTQAFMGQKLTLIPEEGVVIEIDSKTIRDINQEIAPIKKEKGSSQPVDLLDVFNYIYAKALLANNWRPYKVPKIKKVGGYKTIYGEFERDNNYVGLYVLEKEDVFAFTLRANSPDLFKNYENIFYSLIGNNFSVKVGNPIYMVIGMTIAYIASFIGLISAYFYYRRRKGGI